MNRITLNTKQSTDVKGLLISTLPPITKPLIRTQIDTVDGRDGDIVTCLGYSAYNKKFNIGLYGDYDINDVIQFFDSQGTVIFSNEPDKYYNYILYEQIDFERLLRFKTATVTMHVQPFKYCANEGVKTFNTAGIHNIMVWNEGNTKSKPVWTIYGDGSVDIRVNAGDAFGVTIRNNSITLDVDNMEAYKGDTLLNRYTFGDYDNLMLDVGENEISFTGNVTKIEISKYSRWI